MRGREVAGVAGLWGVRRRGGPERAGGAHQAEEEHVWLRRGSGKGGVSQPYPETAKGEKKKLQRHAKDARVVRITGARKRPCPASARLHGHERELLQDPV